MDYQETVIRTVVERLNLASLKKLAQRPGVQSAYRIIVYYVDGRAYNSASTITYETNQPYARQYTQHVGFLNNRTLNHDIELSDYQRFVKTLQAIKFDLMHFPVSELRHTKTIWQIEKATGHFSHSVLISPHFPEKPYCILTNIIDGLLPESVREITV